MDTVLRQWYLGRGGETHGPYTWEELSEFARTGKIRENDLLWSRESEDWIRAGQFAELVPIFRAVATPSKKPVSAQQETPAASPDGSPAENGAGSKPPAETVSSAADAARQETGRAIEREMSRETGRGMGLKKRVLIGAVAGAVLGAVLVPAMWGGGQDLWEPAQYIAEPIVEQVDDGGGTLGELEQHRISVAISEGAFEREAEVALRSPEQGVAYDSDTFTPASPLYDFQIQGEQRLTHLPVAVKIELDRDKISHDELRGVHYHSDFGWTTYEPSKVNWEDGYAIFEVYHNGLLGIAQSGPENRVEEWVQQQSVNDWALEQSGGDLEAAARKVAEEYFADGFQFADEEMYVEALQDTVRLAVSEYGVYKKKKVGSIALGVYDVDGESLGRQLVSSLGKVLGPKGKVAGQVASDVVVPLSRGAGAIVEGDFEGALNHVEEYILEESSAVRLYNSYNKSVLFKMNMLTDDLNDRAYEVYKHGSGDCTLGEFVHVEEGDFDALWEQLPTHHKWTMEKQLEEDYSPLADLHKRLTLHRDTGGTLLDVVDSFKYFGLDHMQLKLNNESQAKERLRQMFEARQEQEHLIEERREVYMRFAEEFRRQGLLDTLQEGDVYCLNKLQELTLAVPEHTIREQLVMDADEIRDETRDMPLKEAVELAAYRLRAELNEDMCYWEELQRRGLLDAPPAEVRFAGERDVTLYLEPDETEAQFEFFVKTIPDDDYRFIWYFGDGAEARQDLAWGQHSLPSSFAEDIYAAMGPDVKAMATHTYTDLSDGDLFEPVVHLYCEAGAFLAEDSMVIRVEQEDEPEGVTEPCDICGKLIEYPDLTREELDEMREYYEHHFCRECADDLVECDGCGEMINKDEAHTTGFMDVYCGPCYDNLVHPEDMEDADPIPMPGSGS